MENEEKAGSALVGAEPASSRLLVLPVALSLLANSIEPIVVKLGFRQNAGAADLLFMKGIVAAAIMFLMVKHCRWVGWKEFRAFVPVCLLFFLINLCVFFALREMSAVALITIVTTIPALVGIVNHIRGRVRLGPRFWLGFSLCFLGVLLTIDVFRPEAAQFGWRGLSLALAAVAGSTLYRTRMDDITAKYSTLLVAFYVFMANGLLVFLLLPWVDFAACQRSAVKGVWLGVAAMVANVAFLSAIKHLGSTQISIFSTLQRPMVIVASALVLKEVLGWVQVLGILMVILGVFYARATHQ